MKDVISVDSLVKKALRTFSVSTSAGDFELRPSGEQLIVDQVKQALHYLLISKLPEKREHDCEKGVCAEEDNKDGFNSAIDDVKAVLAEMFRSGDE